MIPSLLINYLSFLTPSFKLNNGKNIEIHGKGPPVIFSPGLFGTMPRFLYSHIFNGLKKNVSLITTDDYSPIIAKEIPEIIDNLEVDFIGFFSHSSIDSKILESQFIRKAVLCDPIVIPEVDFDGLNTKKIKTNSQILIIKAQQLYESDLSLPNYQNPQFISEKEIKELICKDVGHPDILDDKWAELAIHTRLWKGIKQSKSIQRFNEWKYEKKNNDNRETKAKRKRYRKFVIDKTLEFLNED